MSGNLNRFILAALIGGTASVVGIAAAPDGASKVCVKTETRTLPLYNGSQKHRPLIGYVQEEQCVEYAPKQPKPPFKWPDPAY